MDEMVSVHGQTAVADGPGRRLFTADEYQRLGEAGILRADERVELLEGDILEMPPIGNWHNGTVDVLHTTLTVAFVGRAIVRVQGSFRLSGRSEPEPDILVLRFRPDYYRSASPGPEDVLLLVEVSDSSAAYDRGVKLPLYARAGIIEVWIVDRLQDRLEVYRLPVGDGYTSVTMLGREATVSSAAFPELSIAVGEILG